MNYMITLIHKFYFTTTKKLIEWHKIYISDA